jgi:hypothetical protein
MHKHILLDMDGVKCSFTEAAFALHGASVPYLDVRWDFFEQIGFQGRQADFWAPMGREFWANLPWTREGKALFHGLVHLVGEENVTALSSPCATDGCEAGKRDWLRREVGPQFARRALLGGGKAAAAGPDNILVDDHDDNVDAFRKRGGCAVLVPRPWNCRRGDLRPDGTFCVVDVLAEVKRYLPA